MGDAKSLSHTKWNCKYHIVFAPKYRRQIFYGEKRRAIGEILRKLCEWKGVAILEAEACPDHIHMLLEIPPKFSVSSIMGYLKGKKQPDDIRAVWRFEIQISQPGILVSGILCGYHGENTKKIQEYIKHQLDEDKLGDQLSIPLTGSPFTGRK